MALPAFAQNYPVSVSGQVTDTNGQPMQGLTVIVAVPALNPNGYYHLQYVNTDASGHYAHSFEISNNIPPTDLHIALLDCDSGLVSVVEELVPTNTNSFVNDFTWCAPQTGDCTAALTVNYSANGTAYVSGSVSGAAPLNFGFFPQDPAWTSLPGAGIGQTVETSGLYCVYVEDADGCTNSACQFVQLINQNTCDAYISYDSIGTTTFLTAVAEGTAPFTYLWSSGETTQSVEFTGWGTNVCVTVTDAIGCVTTECLFNQNDCEVHIGATAAGGLYAIASGTAPFSFVWSNGSTSPNLAPNAPGNYCVTITDATGCSANGCFWYGSFPDSCSVYISYDSLGTGDYFTAIASGSAPFTYQWQPGGNTQSIPLDPTYFGDYCVTVTDAEGCVSMDCAWGNNPCSVWILQEDSAGMTGLFAIPNISAATYLWSNGSTDDVIFPTTTDTFCVTVTGGGCVATTCYYYIVPNNMQINGAIYHPDSLNALALEGVVELFYNDPTTNTWGLVATTDILSDPNGWWNNYEFGNQTNSGQYMVKVTLDPASPYAADFLPTYHYSSVLWDEANIITLPSSGWGLYNVLLSDGQNFTNGSGNINGTVTEGDGFTANDEGDRSGTPRPNTSVLLFDENEQPITHTVTDENGQYSFANLYFGTYKLMVEIVGIEQAEKWVTLTANSPASTGNDFEVTETGIVLGLDDIFVGQRLEAFPNPTADKLNFWLETRQNIEARFIVSRTDGTTLLVENQSVAKGRQYVSLDLGSLPSGFYLMQVVAGAEVVSTKIVKQ